MEAAHALSTHPLFILRSHERESQRSHCLHKLAVPSLVLGSRLEASVDSIYASPVHAGPYSRIVPVYALNPQRTTVNIVLALPPARRPQKSRLGMTKRGRGAASEVDERTLRRESFSLMKLHSPVAVFPDIRSFTALLLRPTSMYMWLSLLISLWSARLPKVKRR